MSEEIVTPAPDHEQREEIGQTPQEVLDDDGGLPQPPQNPEVIIVSDEGAEG